MPPLYLYVRISLFRGKKLCLKNRDVVRIEHSFPEINPDIGTANAVIFVLHDGSEEYQFPPAVEEIIGPIREHVERCIRIDRDTGTLQLGQAVLSKIRKSVLIHVVPPRFMVDANREEEFAVPLKHDPENIQEVAAHAELLKMYRTIIGVLNELKECITATVGLEIHSLSPHTPKSQPIPTHPNCDSCMHYSDRWNNRGKKRPTQIFHSFRDESGIMCPIGTGSVLFAQHLDEGLQKNKY